MTSSSATNAAPARRHVAVCTFPFSSHPATLLLLSRKIAASAPDVHVSFFTTPASATSLSASLPPEGGSAATVRIHHIDDGLTTEEGKGRVHPLEAMRKFAEAAGESLRRSMAEAEEEAGAKITCVVVDAFLSYVCREIAEEKKVKWVAVWTSSATDLAAHMYTDELRRRVQAEGGIEAHKEETLDRYIPGFPPIPLSDLPSGLIIGDSTAPIPRMLHTMSQALRTAATVAINTTHRLEPASIHILNTAFGNNNYLSVGPCSLTLSPPTLTAQDPQSCLPFLDTHLSSPASIVYISFGTVHTPPPEEFTALAEALEATGVSFLWSLPERFASCLPKGFVERTSKSGKGKVVSWAPQTSVLDHAAVGAQLTHCGWNSVMESVVSGVPMICRPLVVAEQRLNSRMVVSVWGVGVEVEGGKLTKAAAARAIERVLMEEEGRRMREKIEGMKRIVEEAVSEPDGDSVRDLHKFIASIIS